jgi:putative ABC transport system permease protein
LLLRSFARLLSVDPGFSPGRVVALQVFAQDRNDTPEKLRRFFAGTLDRIRALPGVEQAGAVSAMPFMIANIDIKSTMSIVGGDAAPADQQRGAYLTIAMPGYFETMSIPLREGRVLTGRDTEKSPAVAVITESLRRREWPSESPIGARVRLQFEGQPIEVEVVGVVSDIRHDGLDRAARPELFVPHAQAPFGSMTYVVRGTGSEAALIDAVKREVWALDPMQTFYDVTSVERMVDVSVVRQRFSVTLLSSFAALALLLCAVGVYGLVSFTTLQRTREIGVRMALGADGGAIRRMVLREGAALVLTGLLLGFAGALGASRLLRSLLFETEPGDPMTFAAACVILGGVALAACYFPARRATRIDPLTALRVE